MAPLRRALAAKGVQMLTEHCIARWHGNGATVRNLLTGEERMIAASALVMATTNLAFDPFPERIRGENPSPDRRLRRPAPRGLCLPRGAQTGTRPLERISGEWRLFSAEAPENRVAC